MAYGITSAGFIKKRLQDIKIEIENKYKAAFGTEIDLDPRRPMGQEIAIYSEREAELWELLEEIYFSQYPETADDDVTLDNVVSINNIKRLNATYSSVSITITGTPATVVPVTFQISQVGSPNNQWVPTSAGVIGAGGSVTMEFQAVETGAKAALAGTLTVIDTPIFGIDSVTNALDATVGRERETAAQLRLRRQQTLASGGSSTTEAIRSDLLTVEGVTSAFVFENKTMETDIDGRPPKSFACFVMGGDDSDIAQSIFDNKPAGIETFGSTTVMIIDSQGFEKDINFSRPDVVPIYIEVDLVTNASFPIGGEVMAMQAILAYGSTLSLSDDVIVIPGLISYIGVVPGITDIEVRIGTSVSPILSDNIIIDSTEIASFDSSRITVNVL